MPRADCAADWPCEVLPRAVVVYRSYCTSLNGDRGMWELRIAAFVPKGKPAPNYEAAPAKSAGGKPATGRLCQAGPRRSRASVRHARPATTGYCCKCSQKFAISCRVDSSLRRGFAAQGGDNSEQFPRVRPRSRRAISSAVSNELCREISYVRDPCFVSRRTFSLADAQISHRCLGTEERCAAISHGSRCCPHDRAPAAFRTGEH
jgi:hypothetical protein